MRHIKRRRTNITIQTRQLTIIRTQNGRTNFSRCRSCGQETVIFRPTEAALIFGVHRDLLETLFQSNKIHRADRTALCGNSLTEYFGKEIRVVED